MSGKEALSKADEYYDLLLMDIELPDMSGIDVTLAIRNLEKREGKTPRPIIALTTLCKHQIEEKCLQAGINQVATKPITQAGISKLISHYCMIN